MGFGYQKTDILVNDYELYFIDGINFPLRGPRRWNSSLRKSLSAIGAAQTFGRFVETPFINRFSKDYNILNFGRSGAGPEFYLKNPKVIDEINKTDICFIQIMSARSVSAGLFEAMDNNGVLKFTAGKNKGNTFNAELAFNKLYEEFGQDGFERQVEENQKKWVSSYRELTERIKTKIIFLWIANREPEINDFSSSRIGGFPHLVTADMVQEVCQDNDLIRCNTNPFNIQPLFSRYSGKLVDVFDKETFPNRPEAIRAFNTYYANQEMHDSLYEAIIRLGVLL